MDNYSTKFSETFRKIYSHETIHSVKKRNQEYWWQSKLFKETVELYGIRGYSEKHDPDGQNGPFYTGVNCKLAIPEFNIRLYSPTSTSKQIEVSINFADQNGMIITLNNDAYLSTLLRFFDCSWISRYPDEDERVFVNGYFPIRVASVQMMKTNQNYSDLFAALYLFDILLSGGNVDINIFDKKVKMQIVNELLMKEGILVPSIMQSLTTEQLSTYNELIKQGYKETDAVKAIMISNDEPDEDDDPYVASMFKTYLIQKKHVSIQLANILIMRETLPSSQDILSMIIGDLSVKLYKNSYLMANTVPYRSNLLSVNIFKLIEGVKKITIETGNDRHAFAFNLLYFLEIISSSKKWRQITVQCCTFGRRNHTKQWISYLWTLSATELIQAYRQQQLSIKYDCTSGIGTFYKEYLIIERI